MRRGGRSVPAFVQHDRKVGTFPSQLYGRSSGRIFHQPLRRGHNAYFSAKIAHRALLFSLDSRSLTEKFVHFRPNFQVTPRNESFINRGAADITRISLMAPHV